jgi:hypothetical protein
MPVPAAKMTSARYRAGTASTNAHTVSVGSGAICWRGTFGSPVPSQGFEAISRSRIAALNTPAATPCAKMTERGARHSESRFTQACTSLGLIADNGLSPSVGYVCLRSALSMVNCEVTRCTWLALHCSAYALNVTRPARGSTYSPLTMLAVTSSSHRCASALRAKCLACSLPVSSR